MLLQGRVLISKASSDLSVITTGIPVITFKPMPEPKNGSVITVFDLGPLRSFT